MIEVLFACAIMFIGISGLMALFVVAAAKNAGQGDQATRTTEYAQDKMEQLLSLQYGDSTTCTVGPTNTTDTSVCTGGGAGIAVPSGISSVGGVTSPVANYSDYVTPGGISASAAGATYSRMWMISADTTRAGTPLTVTVVVTSLMVPDLKTLAPSTTLASAKGQY
jgi:hypothetical protein